MMSVTFKHEWEILQVEVSDWAASVFGDSTLHARMEHIRRETYEIEESPDEPLEWADVMLIFLHAMHRQGMSMDDLLSACWEKFHIVRRRDWAKPDEHGVVEHIREDSQHRYRTKRQDFWRGFLWGAVCLLIVWGML